jgi:two-component system response regulator
MTAKTVLLVEDDPDDELMIARAFAKGSIANPVQVARDGAEALAWLFATGDHAGRDVRDTPAMILLDLKLPKVDGLEVLRQVRADPRTRLVPVVVLTSSQAEQDLADSYALRANSFLRKPLDVDRFMVAVAQLGMYWLVINEPPPPPR